MPGTLTAGEALFKRSAAARNQTRVLARILDQNLQGTERAVPVRPVYYALISLH